MSFPQDRPSIAEWVTFSSEHTDPGGWVWWLAKDHETWYLALADINLYVDWHEPARDTTWPWDRWGIGTGGAPLDKGYDTKDAAMMAARPHLARILAKKVSEAERSLADTFALRDRLKSLQTGVTS